LAKKNATNNLSLPRFKKEYSFFEDVYDVVRQIPKEGLQAMVQLPNI